VHVHQDTERDGRAQAACLTAAAERADVSFAPSSGIGLKPQHFDDALACRRAGLWFEVHAENYMVAGGPRLAWLHALRRHHGIALHGVGMSLAAAAAPDPEHLTRLASLTRSVEPILVSEHLAWSAWDGAYQPELLPFPRTTRALQRIARSIAIENPAHYLRFDDHEWAEVEFLHALAHRTGCGLLLDINNVFVSARNLGYSAQHYVDTFPARHVCEIHLAGHRSDPNLGPALLIDSHDTPVCEAVWQLFERVLARVGACATLIERDGEVPGFGCLMAERDRAAALLAQSSRSAPVWS
jgi:uncharacterized protein (UPF0276 family)